MQSLFLDVAPRGFDTLITVTPIVGLIGVAAVGLAGGLFVLLRRFKVADVHAVLASVGLLLAVVITSTVVTGMRVSEENRRARQHRDEQRMKRELQQAEQRSRAASSGEPGGAPRR